MSSDAAKKVIPMRERTVQSLASLLIMSVLVTTVQAQQTGPDLDIIDFKADDGTVRQYEWLHFEAVVANKGHVLEYQRVDIEVNYTTVVQFSYYADETFDLGVNEFKLVTDDDEAYVNVTIEGYPRLEMHVMDLSARQLANGETLRITVRIRNYGTVDAYNVTINFLFDYKYFMTETVDVPASAVVNVVAHYKIPDDLPPGDYEVGFESPEWGGMTESITVTRSLGGQLPMIPLMALAGVLMAVVLVAVLVMSSRKQKGGAGRAPDQEQEQEQDVEVLE
jgi:hypothetical protein